MCISLQFNAFDVQFTKHKNHQAYPSRVIKAKINQRLLKVNLLKRSAKTDQNRSYITYNNLIEFILEKIMLSSYGPLMML